jgi:putative ABC transport system permease protein
MDIRESLLTALRSLRANKARSGLTMLGIIIGVGAVIAMLSIGQGAQAQITDQIQSIGTNLLFVMPGTVMQGGVGQGTGSAQTLTYEDALAMADPLNCPSLALVAPEISTGAQVVYEGRNANTRVTGVTPEYAEVRNQEVAEGQFLDSLHLSARSLAAVLGSDTAETLFGDESPIGKSIRINNISFRVVGVLTSKGGTGFGSQDDIVYVPLTTAEARLGRRSYRGGTLVSTINVQVVDERLMDQATFEISELLRQRHRLLLEDDFETFSQADILSIANQVTGILTIVLGGIAAISLLVGGIGIMNIMLVSVTERTREIGIRKAVGAKRRDILAQFLTEATLLSVIGGAVGILVGWSLSAAVSLVQVEGSGITTMLTLDSVLLATGFSIAVGLFFGIYPAARAAALNPIDALRYE